MATTNFPARVYKDTVLAPLFEGVKRHHWRYQMRVNHASAVLLAECGLLTSEEARAILGALDDIREDPRPRHASSTPASTRISSSTSKPS